jgi:hypothetical protein
MLTILTLARLILAALTAYGATLTGCAAGAGAPVPAARERAARAAAGRGQLADVAELRCDARAAGHPDDLAAALEDRTGGTGPGGPDRGDRTGGTGPGGPDRGDRTGGTGPGGTGPGEPDRGTGPGGPDRGNRTGGTHHHLLALAPTPPASPSR